MRHDMDIFFCLVNWGYGPETAATLCADCVTLIKIMSLIHQWLQQKTPLLQGLWGAGIWTIYGRGTVTGSIINKIAVNYGLVLSVVTWVMSCSCGEQRLHFVKPEIKSVEIYLKMESVSLTLGPVTFTIPSKSILFPHLHIMKIIYSHYYNHPSHTVQYIWIS